jgi:hypothetical protein
MSVDVREKQERTRTDKEMPEEETQSSRPALGAGLRTVFSQIEWRHLLIVAAITAVVWWGLFWSALFVAQNVTIFIGIVPVIAGFAVGRRVQHHLMPHGLLLGLITFLIGMIFTLIYALLSITNPNLAYEMVTPEGVPQGTATFFDYFSLYFYFSILLLPFPAFATVIAGRSEQRNREMRRQVAERGGRLERPSTVRTVEDLQGLSLPQFGTYVSNLFKKHGFTLEDWHFLDKDKHLDLLMSYEEETYLLRLSVADKVRTGTVESLSQDMRRRDIPKGLVITSTEFAPDAQKSAKGRRHIVIVDGQKLFDMAES